MRLPNRKKLAIYLAMIGLTAVAIAATYGPFRCDNGCNSRDPSDGFTAAFIRGTVNHYLNEHNPGFRWQPGDVLILCDGNWCANLDYSPMFGSFVPSATKPGYPDRGGEVLGVNYSWSWAPPDQRLLGRLALACLQGRYVDEVYYSETNYQDGNTFVVVGTETRLAMYDGFCEI